MTKIQLTPDAHRSYKIGLDEVVGLKAALTESLAPVVDALKPLVYWDQVKPQDVEYKSRDGFIANKHNCGGLQLQHIIPKVEEYDFCWLDFGECYTPDECTEYCSCQDEGHLDAALTVFLKFEGIDPDTQELRFYLVVYGGNGDAPYFRVRHSTDYYEAEFSCSSVDAVVGASAPYIAEVVKLIKGAV